MKKTACILFLLVLSVLVFSQDWGDPIQISQCDETMWSEIPNMTIDNNGVMHCVWTQVSNDDIAYGGVYYSKSYDEGSTWITPVCITPEGSLRPNNPKVVCDSQNRLYVCYTADVALAYDVSVKLITNFGSGWTGPELVSNGGGSYHNYIFIDTNDKLYFLWYNIYAGPGLCFRTYENGVWSEINAPYLEYGTHVIKDFSYNVQTANYFIAYCNYNTKQNSWSELEFYQRSAEEANIFVENDSLIHIVADWDSNKFKEFEDTVAYLKFQNSFFSEFELVDRYGFTKHERIYAIEKEIHIVYQKSSDKAYLAHSLKQGNEWNGYIIDSADNLFAIGKPIFFSQNYNLIYYKMKNHVL